jgi:hypothetical protein
LALPEVKVKNFSLDKVDFDESVDFPNPKSVFLPKAPSNLKSLWSNS